MHEPPFDNNYHFDQKIHIQKDKSYLMFFLFNKKNQDFCDCEIPRTINDWKTLIEKTYTLVCLKRVHFLQ